MRELRNCTELGMNPSSLNPHGYQPPQILHCGHACTPRNRPTNSPDVIVNFLLSACSACMCIHSPQPATTEPPLAHCEAQQKHQHIEENPQATQPSGGSTARCCPRCPAPTRRPCPGQTASARPGRYGYACSPPQVC